LAHGSFDKRPTLGSHRCSRAFPSYMEELRGVAEGSGRSLDEVFVMNMREELGYFVPSSSSDVPPDGDDWEQCSDYILKDTSHAAGLHNEDSGAEDLNTTFLLHAVLDYPAPDFPKSHFARTMPHDDTHVPHARPRTSTSATPREFWAYTYSGDLPSGAFGWNPASRMAFSLNYVRPSEGVLGGYGRGFLSRALLDVAGVDQAVDLVTCWGQGAGHNYQLFDFRRRRILNAEAANLGRSSVWEVDSLEETEGLDRVYYRSETDVVVDDRHAPWEVVPGPAFHANEYLHLNISQTPSPSSVARESRAAELPVPKTPDDLHRVLGDTELVNGTWSIYRQGPPDSSYTLHSVLFDLDEQIATIYAGNPKQHRVLYTMKV